MIDLSELVKFACQVGTDDALDDAAYHLGFFEPNYPVPAIRYEWDVDFEHKTAEVFRLHDTLEASADIFDIEYRLWCLGIID